MTMTIDNYLDVIDVRDIIAEYVQVQLDEDEQDYASELEGLLAELAGNGGDEKWLGDWYPVTLIRDSYFVEYAQQLAEDIGAIDPDASWPNGYIDWERAARDLQMDYTSVEYQGTTYWYR